MKEYIVQTEDNCERWYNEDGNVIKHIFDNCEYYFDENGKLHNENGPAMLNDFIREYYIHGERVTKRQWKRWKKDDELTDSTFYLLVKMFKAMLKALNEVEEEKDEAKVCDCGHTEKR